MHLGVVPRTYFYQAWDMVLTHHGDDVLSESEPEYQGTLYERLARYFVVTCLGRLPGPGGGFF